MEGVRSVGACAARRGRRGGVPSRNMRFLLPVPGAGHPWPALGIPPCIRGGPDLFRDLVEGRVATSRSSRSVRNHQDLPVATLLTSVPKPKKTGARPAYGGCAESRPWMAGARRWEQDAET